MLKQDPYVASKARLNQLQKWIGLAEFLLEFELIMIMPQKVDGQQAEGI